MTITLETTYDLLENYKASVSKEVQNPSIQDFEEALNKLKSIVRISELTIKLTDDSERYTSFKTYNNLQYCMLGLNGITLKDFVQPIIDDLENLVNYPDNIYQQMYGV